MYCLLITLSISPTVQGANWLSRLFGFGKGSEQTDADRAADALLVGDPVRRRSPEIEAIFNDLPAKDQDEIKREVAKHQLIKNSDDLSDRRAEELGKFNAKVRKFEYDASPGFFQKIPGRISAGVLDGVQEVVAQVAVAGFRIAGTKTLEAYRDSNRSAEERAYHEDLKKLHAEVEKTDKLTLLLNTRAELIKSKRMQKIAEKELEKIEKEEAEAKKKAEALALQVAIAEQQGPKPAPAA